MHTDQTSYSRWSLVVALILAIILLWMLMNGRGPSISCCNPVAKPIAAKLATKPSSKAAEVAFHFSATGSVFTKTGNTAAEWLYKIDSLKAILGDALRAEGDERNIVLTGEVDSDATKQLKVRDAQAFFGPNINIDNQLKVMVAEPVANLSPSLVKLYFDTGKTSIKITSQSDLTPIVNWLKANVNAKAVISGFHDPRGDKSLNELLAKNRARSVLEALKSAGIDEARIEMRKPQSIEGGADLAEARRVEVSVE
jgi:outer membrane protein OmpA-like peptidoglycan-associated protein